MSTLARLAIAILGGIILGIALGAFKHRRDIGAAAFTCYWFGHAKPVYHLSRSFWWCSRCDKMLGINPDLWTNEAMVEHAEMMRRPDRN
jgi:hypothetical protein